MSSNEHTEPQHTHQVVADGRVIYIGDEWASVFKGAALDPTLGEIVVMYNGELGARWSAPLAPDALRQAIEKQ